MDAKEQAAGEQRVRDHLIDPLRRMGLARPSTLTVAGFDAMLAELSRKLAYMSVLNLQALAEQAAEMAGGKDQDRFPIAKKIFAKVRDIQPPEEDASPLLRAVFAHSVGQQALAEDWAPELLSDLRRTRRWPQPYDLRQIQERAVDARRQITKQDDRLARGLTLSHEDLRLRHDRVEAEARCRRITALVREAQS